MSTASPLKKQYLEGLPEWDLSDFYTSVDAPEIGADIAKSKQLSLNFATSYKGVFSPQSPWAQSPSAGDELHAALVAYEEIENLLGKLMSYGYLCFATQVNNPQILQFFQMIQEKMTEISAHLIFFTLELNLIDDDLLATAYAQSTNLQRYRPWIDGVRLFKTHQLSPDLEKLLHEKSVTGRSAWIRLYDETLSGILFDFEGTKVGVSEILNHLSSKDALTRKQAAQSLSDGLKSNLSLFTLITNTLAKDKDIEDTWRHFPHPIAARNLANRVEDEVVEALATTVRRFYPALSHRYYALKAKWFGVEKIEYWDRNAPFPDAPDQEISWDDAKEIVAKAYQDFSPILANIGQEFFDNAWIDVPAKAGKQSGAFAHPTVPSVHPYILLNYQGKVRDVMTLAHELGHGVHQMLARDQGPLLSSTPLTIAETASVFGEMLTFRALLSAEKDTQKRRFIIAAKIEDMLNTVVRQIAFYDFEQQIHERRKQGELTAEDINEIWMTTQREALGDAVYIDPLVQPYWAYISHFIHAPFYVYAYAFGDCLVNSLYAVYQSGHPNFEEKYIDLLKAGGSKCYPELLAPFGLNAKDPAFWEKGLLVIKGLIDELDTDATDV